MLSPLDEALVRVQNAGDNLEELETQYYELFLNATLFMPTWDVPDEDFEGKLEEDMEVKPVIITEDGVDYIMIFDSQDRLNKWTQDQEPDLGFIGLSGFDVINIFGAQNHLILNVVTDYIKEFIPEEIEWLKANVSNA